MRLRRRKDTTLGPLHALCAVLEALARGDGGGLAARLAPDASLVARDCSPLYGNTSVAAEIVRLFAGAAPLDLKALTMEDAGGLAVFAQRWRRSAPDGLPPAAATTVFRREGDRWLLVLLAIDDEPASQLPIKPSMEEVR